MSVRRFLSALSWTTFVVACVILTARTIARAGAASRDPVASACDPVATTACERRPIDLVICLDTSGSMEALIDSARARLWDIVTSLSRARPTPELRVGLLTYGSPSRSTVSQGWVVRQIDLTSDLDSVYAKMMSFSTDGGDEFVGWVLHDALETMNWSRDPKALKLIFVAGNESADQAKDVYDFRREAALARQKGIIVNAVYAGNRDAGVQERWAEVASCGGGSYTAIDMQCGTVQIETPQDKILIELNMKLNAT
ncbi:MAG: VWA domain-containing protein, partial [Phycisphaerales bacterium]|nr:VWA domain-containing protein [Phycisphaerales bacterium]